MKFTINTPLAIYELGQRENQEDALFPKAGQATDEDRLFILCDGMGGHQSGEVASQTVCEAISSYILNQTDSRLPFTDALLHEAVKSAYAALDERDPNVSDKKMGTTMVFLYLHAGGVMAAHIGDSRYYHIRPATKEILYRSRDHSLSTMRFEAGEVALEDLATMPGKNVILKAMMPHQEMPDMPDIVHIKNVKRGDYFFACSDGILEKMSDKELLAVLCNKDLSDEQKRDCLLTATKENKDNHSAWLIRVTGVMEEEIDENQPDDEAEARENNLLLLAELGELGVAHASGQDEEDVVPVIPNGQTAPAYGGPATQTTRQATQQTMSQTTQQAMPQTTQPQFPPQPAGSAPQKKTKSAGTWIALVLMLLAVAAACFFFIRNNDDKPEPPESAPVQETKAAPAKNRSSAPTRTDVNEGSTQPATGTANPTSGQKSDVDKIIQDQKKVTLQRRVQQRDNKQYTGKDNQIKKDNENSDGKTEPTPSKNEETADVKL